MQPLNLCFLTSEVAPFAKVGGLADVSAALPRQLARAGHDVRVFMPFYARIEAIAKEITPVDAVRDVPVRLGDTTYLFSLFRAALPEKDGSAGLPVHLVHCPALYGRAAIYSGDADEHLRFLLLSRAGIESCQRMGWAPDVIHVNDWQTAVVPLLLRSAYAWDRLFAATRTVLTIHNIGYQGTFPATIVRDLGLGVDTQLLHQEDLRAGVINLLKTGVMYADALTTVSPTYAREIQTEAFGFGLHDLLRARADRLVGILNGVDYDEWSPRHDAFIPVRYSEKSLHRKEKDKQALLEAMGLPYTKGVPVAGIVSRLTAQKGFELLREPLPELLATRPLQLVVLGSGDARDEEFFHALQAQFPTQVCFYAGFSEKLAHFIEAGADLFLMPSRYEPCGLNQMYSLKYGTVPVVRRTGGLADTVELFRPATKEGTGIVFDHFTVEGMRWALGAALDLYPDRKAWQTMMRNGMAKDFSWEAQVKHYEDLYARLTARQAVS